MIRKGWPKGDDNNTTPYNKLSIITKNTHLPRCTIRLTNPKHTRQRSLYIFYLYLSPYRDLKPWRGPSSSCHSNSLCGLCFTMRTNIILRGHSNYKSSICYPLRRNINS
uniref:Uncharacterized protein n=1 Tax=Anolis carolinensis TaxID=28377 RepID=A0A803SV03_ANOCA